MSRIFNQISGKRKPVAQPGGLVQMRISKVKLTEERTNIEYKSVVDDGAGSTTERSVAVNSTEKPLAGFWSAMRALAGPLCKALGLEEDYLGPEQVTTVHFKGTDEAPQFIICAHVDVDGTNKPFNITSPLLDEENFTALSKLVLKVDAAAAAYIDGHREQADMFAGGTEAPDSTDDAGDEPPVEEEMEEPTD